MCKSSVPVPALFTTVNCVFFVTVNAIPWIRFGAYNKSG